MDVRKRLILITRPVYTTSGARDNCAINVCLLINTVIKRYVYIYILWTLKLIHNIKSRRHYVNSLNVLHFWIILTSWYWKGRKFRIISQLVHTTLLDLLCIFLVLFICCFCVWFFCIFFRFFFLFACQFDFALFYSVVHLLFM